MADSRGRIEAALKRARERQQAERQGAAGAAPGARPARPTPASPAIREAAAKTMLRFPRVHYDSKACAAARILVGDGEGLAHAPGAAAYRMLRTRILQRTRSNAWTCIGVTSPGQGEGKSVTALNLALAIAREGNSSVFLIDLDMRNPKMCEYLGAIPPREINDFFTGDAKPEEVLFSIGVDNLVLAGTLTRTDEASELLAAGFVEELFGYIRSITPEPLILVDLPPLLSTDDAIIMAPKVDACLLVLSEGKSRRDSAATALELLAEYKLAGIVLNRSHTVVADYYG